MSEEQPQAPQQVMVLSRQKPHMILLLVLGILSGLSSLLGPYESRSMDHELPRLIVDIWGWFLLGSSLIAMVGNLGFRRNRVRGMLIERGALLIQAGMVLLYGTMLVALFGWGATLSGGATLAWAGANLWEAQLIRRDLGLIARMR